MYIHMHIHTHTYAHTHSHICTPFIECFHPLVYCSHSLTCRCQKVNQGEEKAVYNKVRPRVTGGACNLWIPASGSGLGLTNSISSLVHTHRHHTCLHTYTTTHMHSYIFPTHLPPCVQGPHTHIYTYTHTHMCTHTHTHTYTYTHTHT